MLDEKLSLVLPAHNEAANIEAVVGRIMSTLPELLSDFEVLIVDDGSQDGTGPIIDRIADENVRVQAIHHEVNRGYGAALQSGFDAATGDLIMFMDSDRQFDIADITALLPYVPHYDIVAGYRIKRRDPLYRRLYGKLFELAVWILFGVHVHDVDCAFKIYRADLIRSMQLSTHGALINTELLALAKRKGASLVQVGVHHYPRSAGKSSGGSPKVVFRAMGETLRLWWRLRQMPPDETEAAHEPWSQRRLGVGPLLAAFGTVVSAIALLIWWRRR